jgi:Flp pilus assembly pilin Flp
VKIGIFALARNVAKLVRDETGQVATEYLLLCALVACGATAGYTGVAQAVDSVFNQISATFVTALKITGN